MVHVILTWWHPHRRLGEQFFLQAHLMSSRCALGALGLTAYFGFHPSYVFVQYQSSGLGSHIWGHMDWPHAYRSWYNVLLVSSSSATFCRSKISCANVPLHVKSSFLTPLMCPSLVVLSSLITEHLSVAASSSAPIVSVLTDSSLNDSVILGYTLQTVHTVFFTFSCNDRQRIVSHKLFKLRKRSWFCWS